MRPLNRPMFKMGGPIKEGIMQGMKEPQAINTVGNNANRDAMGREKHGFFIPFLASAAMQGARMLAPRAIAAGAKAFGRGVATGAPGTSPFASGITGMQRLRNLLPTGRFLDAGRKIAMGGKNPRNLPVPFGSTVDATGKLSLRQALTDPRRLGMAVRENPAAAFLAAGQIKNIPDIVGGGLGLAADAGLGGVNYLLGTDFSRDKSDIKETKKTDLKRTDKITNVGEVDTKTTTKGGSKNLSDSEKQKINEDRINETKQKYYKLMGIDNMNKEAAYDSLINASKIIQEEGGDLKGSIKSGNLQSRIIDAISKNLDKSADLKKQIDAAVLKGEIEKDINKTKLTSFQEQIKFIRENPDDPLAKKLSGATSVADLISASVASGKGATLTSDNIASFIESKGATTDGVIPDDKYQKWSKANEGKDEIDFFIEKYSGLDDGLYVVNKKAFRKQGNQIAPVSLDSIIG